MMKSIKFFIIIYTVILLSAGVNRVKAQCAMCTATVETNAQSGSAKTRGLNNGILFLLGAPYFAVALGGYIWYKKYRRKDVKLEMRGEKLNLN